MAETESFNQRNAPRLTGGTPATRRRKVGGRSGSPHIFSIFLHFPLFGPL
jgi:hypothetical protein